MNAEILALSASAPLPIPVGLENKANANGVEDEKENGLYGLSPRSLQGTSPSREPIAPYQALPVMAATITHNMTAALPVFEPSEMSHEVNICSFYAASFASLIFLHPLE